MNIKFLLLILLIISLIGGGCVSSKDTQRGWISLFDGKSLQGWSAGSQNETFSVKDGMLIVQGPRDHLFYDGPVQNHNFQNFEFKADVKTTEGSNSGIYFHTQFQDEGWPSQGYEVQINNSYQNDPRRTGSLYGIDNIRQSPVADSEWFTLFIKVQGEQVLVKVDGEILVDYKQTESAANPELKLAGGTFALQGHDPESKVFFKNIFVKPLR